MSEKFDISNSVIIPREDFIELQTAAFDTHQTAGDRIGTAFNTTVLIAGMAAGVTAATWGWTKAVDWLEDRKFNRQMAEKKFDLDNKPAAK